MSRVHLLATRRRVQASGRALALALVAGLAGCVSPDPIRLDEWGGAQNCHFAHVTKQEFETALRRVFDASHPRIYGLRPEEGGALVEKHWALDVVFASASGAERWRLEYAPAGDGIDVHAQVEPVSRTGLPRIAEEVPPQDIAANYRLLWSRIAYVLGDRTDWPRCPSSSKGARRGLCSSGAAAVPLKLARSH